MEKNENIEIQRILDILFSKKIMIVCILIIFILLGYLYSYHYVIPEYKSTSTLLLLPNSNAGNDTITNSDLILNSGLISTYSNIAKKSKVLKQVISNLGLNMTEEELLSNMKINIIKDTYIIEIAIINQNAQLAMDITTELANVFLNEIKEIYNLDNIGIVDGAQFPEQPYNVNHVRDILIFILAGMSVSFVYVMGIYIFDNTLKKEEDIEKYIKIMTLGSIPMNQNKKQELIHEEEVKSYVTECINTIRTNILYMNAAKNAKTILVTSCTPREGKSWVSANIAASFAETNKKVLLIDSDMRKGRANKIFQIDNTEGLSNCLYFMTGDIKKDIELGKKYIQETQIPNLHILTNGNIPPNPSELLGSNQMKELVALLKYVYDIIIIDAPPCMPVTDGILLSTIVDSTVLVVNAEQTKMKDLQEVVKSIQSVGGKIIGAIVNKVRIKGKIYNKSYYYGHSTIKRSEKKEQIISVEEVMQQAMPILKSKNFNIFFEENKMCDKKEEENHKNHKIEKELYHKNEMEEFIKIQNSYLEGIMNTISDIKIQVNNNIIQNKLKSEERENNLEKFISKKIEQASINTNERIEEVVHYQEEAKKQLKEEMERNDYTEQINNINEMIEILKDNYLELSNRISANQMEEDKIDNRNIIDMRVLKKQRENRKKKKVYSIHEEISYYELEETASCIIPIKKENIENFLPGYKSMIQ